MHRCLVLLLLFCLFLFPLMAQPARKASELYVQVSDDDPRYLELSDGSPYIPIGLNMIAAGGRDKDQALATMKEWMRKLAQNQGNYFRVWLGNADWDVEHERAGEFDEVRARRLEDMLEYADSLGLRVKLTLEHFRHFNEQPGWSGKPIYHKSRGGFVETVPEFFTSEAGKAHFKRKLDWYADRFGSKPVIFAWELWNEVNAVSGGGVTLESTAEELDWTAEMLDELEKRFAPNLVTQSLGSFDDVRVRDPYRVLSQMENNQLAQVHRYLDLGANLTVAHGPVDVLAADAVRELLAFDPQKPVLLAESGAVEPKHTGPFKLYQADTAGTILHDVLFAPFFAGAAGPGQIWHWNQYVDPLDLWFQFDRFANAVKGINPAAEHFIPVELPHPRLRIYALLGRKTLLLWGRDRLNDWRSELARGEAPLTIENARIDLSGYAAKGGVVEIYDPWKNVWTTTSMQDGVVKLPAFKRSIVVRVELDSKS